MLASRLNLVRFASPRFRAFSTSVPISADSSSKKRNEPRYNYVANPFDSTPDPDQANYKLVTAKEIANRQTPPKRVKMLVRDFIDDCLYNPHYGYFSTQAVIFDPDKIAGPVKKGIGALKQENVAAALQVRNRAEGFDFAKMRNSREFEDEIARRYGEFEMGGTGVGKGPGRQVWHTPTELFKVRLLYPTCFWQLELTAILHFSHGTVER